MHISVETFSKWTRIIIIFVSFQSEGGLQKYVFGLSEVRAPPALTSEQNDVCLICVSAVATLQQVAALAARVSQGHKKNDLLSVSVIQKVWSESPALIFTIMTLNNTNSTIKKSARQLTRSLNFGFGDGPLWAAGHMFLICLAAGPALFLTVPCMLLLYGGAFSCVCDQTSCGAAATSKVQLEEQDAETMEEEKTAHDPRD